jgi:hypothetical protein
MNDRDLSPGQRAITSQASRQRQMIKAGAVRTSLDTMMKRSQPGDFQMIYSAFMFCLAIPVRGARGVARMSEINITLFLIIPWFVIAARSRGGSGIMWAVFAAFSYGIPTVGMFYAYPYLVDPFNIYFWNARQNPLLFGISHAVRSIASAAVGVLFCWLVKRHFLQCSSERELSTSTDKVTEYFWRGPIRTSHKARDVIKWASWIFIVFGFECFCFSVTDSKGNLVPEKTGDLIGDIVFCLGLFMISAILLLTTRISLAAGLLFVASISLVVSTLFLATDFIFSGVDGKMKAAPVFLAPLILLLGLTLLSWRAFKATRVLHGTVQGLEG